MSTDEKHWNATHGRSRTKEYRAWLHAKERCYNPADPRFPRYGERGIVMCEKWVNDFAAFFEDMGEAPTPEHTLERKDRDANYSPENCVWADRMTQANNTSGNVTVGDTGLSLAEYARSAGLQYKSFHHYFITRKLSLEVATEKATKLGQERKRGQGRFYTADMTEIRHKAGVKSWENRRA